MKEVYVEFLPKNSSSHFLSQKKNQQKSIFPQITPLIKNIVWLLYIFLYTNSPKSQIDRPSPECGCCKFMYYEFIQIQYHFGNLSDSICHILSILFKSSIEIHKQSERARDTPIAVDIHFERYCRAFNVFIHMSQWDSNDMHMKWE